MKIEYTLILWGNQHNSMQYAREVKTDYCCEEMCSAWYAFPVGLGFHHGSGTVRLRGHDSEGDYELGQAAFKFCPFCGAPIELVQTAEEDNRVKACVQELTRVKWDGSRAYCSKNAVKDSDYCGRHTRRRQAEVMAAAFREAP